LLLYQYTERGFGDNNGGCDIVVSCKKAAEAVGLIAIFWCYHLNTSWPGLGRASITKGFSGRLEVSHQCSLVWFTARNSNHITTVF